MTKTLTSPPTHNFAWDGFSFDVPDDWNMSMYFFGKKVSDLRMEDDDTLRLEMEWTRRKHRIDEGLVLERFEKRTKSLVKNAESHEKVEGLPTDWTAFVYTMPNRKKLAIAYCVGPNRKFFGFFRLHFEKVGRKKPQEALKLVARSFKVHDDDRIPWRVYDVDMEVARKYWLVGTQFEAGCKLMTFQWRMRRLFVWHLSLADVVLKGKTVGEFAAEFLSKVKWLRGLEFSPDGENRLSFKRRRMFLHYEEIGRMCFKYGAACVHLPEKNTVVLAVVSYRRGSDIDGMNDMFRCGDADLF